jgi:hypothetical protein
VPFSRDTQLACDRAEKGGLPLDCLRDFSGFLNGPIQFPLLLSRICAPAKIKASLRSD